MKLDANSLYAFLMVLVRLSMLITVSQFYGTSIPRPIRNIFLLSLSMAFSLSLYDKIGPVPDTLYLFVLRVLFEGLVGIVIGYIIYLFFAMVNMAGSYFDISIGLGMAQQMNPLTGHESTIISRMVSMLIVLYMFIINAHHLMFRAFIDSYNLPMVLSINGISEMVQTFSTTISWCVLTAVQIASPVLALTACVDVASGIVNKSVPLMPIYLISLPVKIALGLIVISFGLPAFLVSFQSAFEGIIQFTYEMLKNWK